MFHIWGPGGIGKTRLLQEVFGRRHVRANISTCGLMLLFQYTCLNWQKHLANLARNDALFAYTFSSSPEASSLVCFCSSWQRKDAGAYDATWFGNRDLPLVSVPVTDPNGIPGIGKSSLLKTDVLIRHGHYIEGTHVAY